MSVALGVERSLSLLRKHYNILRGGEAKDGVWEVREFKSWELTEEVAGRGLGGAARSVEPFGAQEMRLGRRALRESRRLRFGSTAVGWIVLTDRVHRQECLCHIVRERCCVAGRGANGRNGPPRRTVRGARNAPRKAGPTGNSLASAFWECCDRMDRADGSGAQAGMPVLHQKKDILMVRYFLGFLRNSTMNSRMSLESAERLS
jgi:hypothetical protein